MDYNDFFTNRRTIRNFSSKPVSDELLRALVEQASHAPTTGNMQVYSIVATRSQEVKKLLAPAHFNQPCATSCALLLTFCADFNRFTRWCRISDADPGYDNFQSFITALLDTTIFAQQFCTTAEMHGLGTCYLGTTTYNAPQIAHVLNLPARVVPVTTVALGWPDGNKPEDAGRLPVEAVLHIDTYKNPTDEQIKALYADKEARDDSRRFVTENGKTSLAQVFTDVRYTRDANERFSKIYADFIAAQGFTFP